MVERMYHRALLIDNYDSYTFNVYHLLAQECNIEPILVQNDDYSGNWDLLIEGIGKDSFTCIVIGPGPGTPEDVQNLGLSAAAVSREDIHVPILGICLGMQAMAVAFGARVLRAPIPMHGRLSLIHSTLIQSKLFENIDFPFKVVRYHSLSVQNYEKCSNIKITALSKDDNVVMALEHSTRKLFGIQFHPESICAGKEGSQIIKNFLKLCSPSSSISFINNKRFKGVMNNDDDSNKVLVQDNNKFKLHVKMIKNPKCVLSTQNIFLKLFSKDKCRAWLDSAMEHPKRGRFSILTSNVGPIQLQENFEFFVENKRMGLDETHEQLRDVGECILRIYRSNNQILEKKGHGCEPFSYLVEQLENKKPGKIYFSSNTAGEEEIISDNCNILPFNFACGYVGVLGYGLRKLCGVKHVNDDSHFVLSNITTTTHDKQPDSAFFFSSRAIVFDHQNDIAYVLTVTTGDCEEEQSNWTNEVIQLLLSEEQQKEEEQISNQQIILLVPNRTKDEYIQDVQKSLYHILQGDTYEVCLTNQLHANMKIEDHNKLYFDLRRNNPAPFCGFLAFKHFSICSSSPERFLQVNRNSIVESRPIKGTTPRIITDMEQDEKAKIFLGNSEKDRAENLMIVDLVRNDISKVCETGSVIVPELMIVESFKTVHQLVSTIQGKLKDGVTAVHACREAFPPGSMTGAPKERTMQIIDSIEESERGFYSGALGFFSLCGSADFNVLIRTAIITENQVKVGAGGAVVAMSDPISERDEMILKVKALGATFRVDE